MPQVLWGCAAAYFAYHAIQGDRGLVAWLQLQKQLGQVDSMLQQARQERETLEHRVALLRSSSLDPDMLDERVRAVLGYVGPDEEIHYYTDTATDEGADTGTDTKAGAETAANSAVPENTD